ncbi:hypothetical protein [Sulfurimonas sp.]|uniref:hypothetical protein n=1 Tax=Sulfurimonas sp. TaxID=2022749 RepID=UPI0025FDE9CE|nr:hypothetical protein [Sulfurimonas sp.]MDD5156463.1 hypothetical protein [Sulfurimonas sp.]
MGRGGFLSAVVKVAKAINKANAKAAKEKEKQARLIEKEKERQRHITAQTLRDEERRRNSKQAEEAREAGRIANLQRIEEEERRWNSKLQAARQRDIDKNELDSMIEVSRRLFELRQDDRRRLVESFIRKNIK